MSLYKNLDELSDSDTLTVIMFILGQLQTDKQYGVLSKLAYILNRDQFLSMCEIFGGTTIKIPTVEEFKIVLYGIQLYVRVNINKEEFEQAISDVDQSINRQLIVETYTSICDIMKEFSFGKEV